MIRPQSGRINGRIKPGSALERFLQSRPQQTTTGALHDLAAAYEALTGGTSAILSAKGV